jgi:hypothetical protein
MATKKKGPRSLKSRKKKYQSRRRKHTRAMSPPSTREPFEQDFKRRIGQHTGTGEPPLMKK